jgi:hypothetical protein
MKNKLAQVTIFIILGLIVVVGLIIVFFLFNPPEIRIVDENNPQAFIESCTRQATEEAISLLSPRGGDISPKGYIPYEGEDITYLCYNERFYESCVNQRPLLVEHIEEEITKHITTIVADCFFDLRQSLGNRYDVEEGEMAIRTRLQSGHVTVKIDKNFKISRSGDVRDFNQFRMNMVHPIYEFAKISMEIVNQEILFCNFDELGHNILHPQYDVRKFITGNSDIIYTIIDIDTEESFVFALKSCTLPPGY